jgi:IclR family acetate operon transcriptional repressor
VKVKQAVAVGQVAPDRGADGSGADFSGADADAANEHGESAQPRQSTIGKVTVLLEALASAPRGVSVREFARETGIDKSAVSRMLEQLAVRGFVERESLSSRFRAGPALFALAATIHARDTLWQAAEPVIRDLARGFNETCYLATREGDEIMFREKIDCDHPVRYVIDPGERAALHAGAGGRAVLAGLPEAEVSEVVGRMDLRPYTEQTITDAEELRRQIQEDHRRGYSISMGERVVTGCAIAAPFYNGDGSCRGAIVFTCPRERFDVRRAPEIADAVVAASARLSARLGFANGAAASRA